MKTRLLTLLAAVMCATSLMAATYSGRCGTNLNWSLDTETRVLTITGSGDMYNYEYFGTGNGGSTSPWYGYACRGYISSVDLPDGLTTIGNYAFYGCSSLISITIPNSVTSINEGAFDNCSGLTSITIPNSVNIIGTYAFCNCSGLTGELIIPNSVTTIGNSAFGACDSLTGIIVDVTNPNYSSAGGVLFNKSKSTLIQYPASRTEATYIIPNSVSVVEPYAFYNCSGLTSVTIGNSVTSIEDYAFQNCINLKTVYNLSTLNIRKGSDNNGYVAYYADIVYNGFPLGDFLYSPQGTQIIAYTGQQANVTIPSTISYEGETSTVTSIGSSAFANCTTLTSVTIPNTITSIATSAFSGCSGLTRVNWNAEHCRFSSYSSTPFYSIRSQITDFVFGNIDTIPDYICDGMSNLSNISIPNTVKHIGNSAFYGCSGLTNMYLPNSVQSVGNSAFMNCTGLTSINIPNAVTSLPYELFKGCSGLTSVTIPNAVTEIGAYAFENCTGLTNITIPNAVTSIGWSAFNGCTNLANITIPNSVTSIGSYAFSGCSNLASVQISDLAAWCGITFDESSANPICYGADLYLNGAALTELEIPETVNVIKHYAFYNGKFTSVNIPNSVSSIGSYVFANCADLQMVSIGEQVNSVGTGAFGNCTNLVEITCHAVVPPACSDANAFGNYNGYLYVPCEAKQAYELHAVWGSFRHIECIVDESMHTLTLLVNDADAGTVEGAGVYADSSKVVIKATANEYYEFVRWSDGSTQNPRRITITSDTTLTAYFVGLLAEEVNNVNDMSVVPSDDNATFTWPTTSGAVTYTLTISKDGVVFCTLTFNANGQLVGIAFMPARDANAGSRYASVANAVGGGLQFTVTGLDEASAYTYVMEVKNADNQTVAAYSGVFATTGYEGEMPDVPVVDGVETLTQSREDANGVRYNVLGQPVGEDYKGIVIVKGKKYLVR